MYKRQTKKTRHAEINGVDENGAPITKSYLIPFGQRLKDVYKRQAYTLQEILTIKSDDVVGRVKTYEAIVKGHNVPKPGVPESFKVLVKELQSLGLDLKVLDKNMEEIHLNDDDDDDDAYEDIVRGGGAQEEMGSQGVALDSELAEAGFGIGEQNEEEDPLEVMNELVGEEIDPLDDETL